MSKLLIFMQTKGKWHRFPSFNLGGGAKLYKNFAQKLLAVSLCMAVVLLGTPVTTFSAAEPDKFITAAKANHWGRSDLRAYLNGVEKVDNTLPLDTTHDVRQTSGYYASQFSAAEYALVQPFTYSTNVLAGNDVATSTYSTTDRFWLPSGNFSFERVLSWGATDVSRDSDYSGNFDSAHAIPISYWPAEDSFYSWLRSPSYIDGNFALGAYRGLSVSDHSVINTNAAAAAFKLDLSSVIFASAASAASLAAEGGSRTFEIKGSSVFGEQTLTALPDYGMYLKTENKDSFTPTALGLSADGKTLTVNYTGGVADRYVVVQAFKEDNPEAGTTSYEAAAPLSAGQASATLDVSSWGLSSLDDYTIKVWMEDASGGSSLAAATAPVTFVGSGGSITKTETGAATNQRVFAMKNDLQTSWGTLANKTDLVGTNPTNQKIYFGTKDGAPLEFGIAGRETYAAGKSPKDGDGTIDPNGNVMTLYQAKSVETRQFNASDSNYDGNKKSVTLQLADEQTAEYTGSAVAYPTDKVTAKVIDSSGSPVEMDIPFNNLRWQHRAKEATAWREGMPSGAGTYQLRCYAPGVTDSYERTYSSVVTFTISPAVPDDSGLTDSPTLEATYGQPLGDIKEGLASAIGSFLGVDDQELEGVWAWENDTATKVGNVGKNPFTALFAPTDTNNYDWTTLDGWNDTLGALAVTVAVTVSVDTSKWGTAEDRVADGKTQFVDSAGKTSVEISEENLSANDVLWLREESYDTSAWYGIDLSSDAFDLDKGLRLYVRWLSPKDADYNTYYSQLDDAQKARVEGDNGWIFLIGVEDPDGKKVPPAHPVNVYVQLGDPNEGADWDLEHLKAYYITSGGDENVPVEDVTNFTYPGGTDEFGMMTLSHFSPYFIFDELTDEEKAALTPKPNDNTNNQTTDKPNSSGTDLPGTGDLATQLLISALAIVLVSSLGVMLRLITGKKKFEE